MQRKSSCYLNILSKEALETHIIIDNLWILKKKKKHEF